MRLCFRLLCFLPCIFASFDSDVYIDDDDDCWSIEKNNAINKTRATLVKFSPKIAYGKDSCSVYINNPWTSETQNGFGVFLVGVMDCSSTLTISCLSERSFSRQLTCHSSDNKFEVPCNSINLEFQRTVRSQERNSKSAAVQVVALAKGPCIDHELLFQCPNDYPTSCIDRDLLCNGRSECPNGGDERDCHPPAAGIPIFVIVLIVLAFLLLICVLSIVLICCCCKAVFCGISQRFRGKRAQQGGAIVTGEDPDVKKRLTIPDTLIDRLPQRPNEPDSLPMHPTKPMYPQL